MTKIEWVKNSDGSQGRSWNPVTGCTKISPGCLNCYAERVARRLLAGRYGYPEAPNHFDVTLHPDRLSQPLSRQKPTTYFVCSMSDLFHEDVPTHYIADVWNVMRQCPQHTFQILTKRPQMMLSILLDWDIVLANVWLGVSIETPGYSYRATILAEIPATVRFVSLEPLLCSFAGCPGVLDNMDWAIVGGESGPGARPMNPSWPQGIRDQCVAAGVPFFFKQHGAWAPLGTEYPRRYQRESHWFNGVLVGRIGKKAAGRLLDGQEWNEMPIGEK